MNVRSIGARLTLWYMGLLAATLIFLGGTAYFLLTYSLQREIDAALSAVASSLADRAGEGADLSVAQEAFLRSFGFVPLNPYFEMLDPEGNRPGTGGRNRRLLVTQRALENASQGIATFETIEIQERYPIRILTRPVIVKNRVVNLVQAGISLERTHRTSQRFLLILVAILPVGLVMAGGGGWVLARRSLRPVHLMTQAARRITAFRLSERLKESGTGDELDQLAQTLNETLERLDESFNQMRQFSADASHELQTPLTVLKGEIEVALRVPRSTGEYRETLKSALDEVDRLARLVEGLLLLARADSGVLRIDRSKLDVAELISAVVSEVGAMAKDSRVALKYDCEEGLSFLGDPILFRQLVHNLIVNGLKYTPEGGCVQVKAEGDGSWVKLGVSDTGPGISAKEQGEIFRRFYRSAQARSEWGGGAGLGLSIVQSIAKAHGGTIELESEPGKGSTFTVKLPQQRKQKD